MTDELPLPPPPEPLPLGEQDVPWIVYDAAGRIIRTGRSQTAERALAQGDGGTVIIGVTANDEHDYVTGGEITPRPMLAGFDKLTILADGVDVAAITLPVGAEVRHDGQVYVIDEDDQTFEFAADVAGEYRIEVGNVWPYYDASYVIEAVEAAQP